MRLVKLTAVESALTEVSAIESASGGCMVASGGWWPMVVEALPM